VGAIKEGVWEPGVKDVGSRELRYPPLPPPPQPLGHTIYLLRYPPLPPHPSPLATPSIYS